jgi:hypothetical protein
MNFKNFIPHLDIILLLSLLAEQFFFRKKIFNVET